MTELSERMYIEFLAAAAYDRVYTRDRMEEHWRLLKGPDAKLGDEVYEKAVVKARILNTPASKKIDLGTKKGVAKAQSIRDPYLWHLATMAALAYGADRQGFVPWVLQQPELDRATAGWVFLWLDGQAFLRGVTTFHHDRLKSEQILTLLRSVCTRSEQTGFSNNQIGLENGFESDRIKCLEVIADGEVASGVTVPMALMDRPFAPPQDDGRYALIDGFIVIAE